MEKYSKHGIGEQNSILSNKFEAEHQLLKPGIIVPIVPIVAEVKVTPLQLNILSLCISIVEKNPESFAKYLTKLQDALESGIVRDKALGQEALDIFKEKTFKEFC